MPSPSLFANLPPTRFRGLSRVGSATGIVLTLAAIVGLLAVAHGYQPPAAAASADRGDLAMYGRIVEHMRQGQDYYTAAHAELMHGAYGTRSVFNWRLPTLSWLTSLLPSPAWADTVLQLIAAAGVAFAFTWLDRTAGRLVAMLAVLALGVNLVACFAPGAALFSDIVAGALIFVSVSAYGARLPAIGFAAALAALFCRELAAPYVLLCAVFAWREQRRWELIAWLVGLAAFAVYFGWHYGEVQAHLGPADIAYPAGWLQFGGPQFVLGTAAFNGLLISEPLQLTAIIFPLGLMGLIAWRGAGAARAGLTVAIYVGLFLFVGKRFDDYWGALYTPLMMLGVAFVPAAMRDLFDALRAPRSLAAV